MPEYLPARCCSYNQSYVPIGTTLQSDILPDTCTRASLICRKKESKANLEIVIEDNCPKEEAIMNVIMNTTAIITTPGFPSPYPGNVDECWSRAPSCGHSVRLEFTQFNVSFIYLQNIKMSLPLLPGSWCGCLHHNHTSC